MQVIDTIKRRNMKAKNVIACSIGIRILFLQELVRHFLHFLHESHVGTGQVKDTPNKAFGDNEGMERCSGMEILKRKQVACFAQRLGGLFSPENLAKDGRNLLRYYKDSFHDAQATTVPLKPFMVV
jgi:hypothetical protein